MNSDREQNFLRLIKEAYKKTKKPSVNIILSGKTMNSFPLKTRGKKKKHKNVLCQIFCSTLY
jgi:hypothetical protein